MSYPFFVQSDNPKAKVFLLTECVGDCSTGCFWRFFGLQVYQGLSDNFLLMNLWFGKFQTIAVLIYVSSYDRIWRKKKHGKILTIPFPVQNGSSSVQNGKIIISINIKNNWTIPILNWKRYRWSYHYHLDASFFDKI